ncbi:MAG: gamma-glutamyl-gamma-aminobutyrate hydrolase family protein [bacterium]
MQTKFNKGSRPTIGITTYGRNEHGQFHLYGQYVDAVRQAGGLPVLLPPGDEKPGEILNIVDGLILAGGGDIDPKLYGGNHHSTIERIDPERDIFEKELALAVLEATTPVLGICRGQQMLNIVTGGNLIEHLPEVYGAQVIHRAENKREIAHSVRIEASSKLAEITGETKIEVMSLHHQAIGDVSGDWKVVAWAADGVIEAQEHLHHPWMLAVQWHPELSSNDEQHRRLFRALIEAASEKSWE